MMKTNNKVVICIANLYVPLRLGEPAHTGGGPGSRPAPAIRPTCSQPARMSCRIVSLNIGLTKGLLSKPGSATTVTLKDQTAAALRRPGAPGRPAADNRVKILKSSA